MNTGTSRSPLSMCLGTFFYLCSLLDGCSRAIVHWELRETMTEADVEIILQRGLEISPRQTSNHLSQRPAVHGPRFQGVYPHRRSDPCAHLALLPSEQWENRTL